MEDAPRHWCNYLFSSRCPFVHGAHGEARDSSVCRFLHLDVYVATPGTNRPRAVCMTIKHAKCLVKEMVAMLNARAHHTPAACDSWSDVDDGDSAADPCAEAVAALRALGWAVPDAAGGADGSSNAHDIVAILSVVAHTLHYALPHTPEFMLQTVAWVCRGGGAAAAPRPLGRGGSVSTPPRELVEVIRVPPPTWLPAPRVPARVGLPKKFVLPVPPRGNIEAAAADASSRMVALTELPPCTRWLVASACVASSPRARYVRNDAS